MEIRCFNYSVVIFLCNLFVGFAFLTDDDVSNSKISNRDHVFCEHRKFEGQVLPDFSAAVDLDGKPISLADYRGKVVLLDFWAVWCGPCLGEIPRIKAVYEKYHAEGFDVIGVSLDEDAAVLREFIKEQEIPWRQILDGNGFGGAFANQYGIRSIPAPFLIDREGKVISVKARGRLLEELVTSEIDGKKS